MTHQRLGDLATDAQAWVQRCHRLLENDADLVASDVPDLFGDCVCISRPEAYFAGRDLDRWHWAVDG